MDKRLEKFERWLLEAVNEAKRDAENNRSPADYEYYASAHITFLAVLQAYQIAMEKKICRQETTP